MTFTRYWLPVIIWAGGIFILSSFSEFPSEIQPIVSFDKFWHTLVYAGLGFLLVRAFDKGAKDKFKNNFRLIALICAILYGVSDEFHQHFVPERTMSVFDLIFDGVGAFLGQLVYRSKLF